MHVHVLYDAAGEIHAVFHPSLDANAPQLTFSPGSGQHAAVLEVPATLAGLAPRALHAAAEVRMESGQPRLAARRRREA